MKTRALLYCTKSKWRLFFDKVKQIFSLGRIKSNNDLNGKIVAECDYEVEEIACAKIDYARSYSTNGNGEVFYDNSIELTYKPFYLGLNISNITLSKRSCLTNKEMYDYLQGENGYAIYIKNLNIFDEPKELSDFTTRKPKTYDTMVCDSCVDSIDCKQCPYNYEYQEVMKAPQNMMKVCEWDLTDYILISIRPEWMCKILNREKDVEVRRVVLKEMLNNE